MSEQSLSEKIAALPAEERAARYLQVVREQGLSMATQKRCLDEKDETIAALRQRVADLTRALERVMIGGNHLATYAAAGNWPAPDTDLESALRIFCATKEYDMWCCWREIMLARAALASSDSKGEPK